MGIRARMVGASALAAGTLPLVFGQGVAAAGESTDEISFSFTYAGRRVTCTAEAWSSLDDDGPAPGVYGLSMTSVTEDPACIADLSLFVSYVDTHGTEHYPNAYAYGTTDSVIYSTGGVRDNYTTVHTGSFRHCNDPGTGQNCYFELRTAPK
jgi:hypothetical protein